MLTNFRVQNFQSLHKVDLNIAKFTVIVGPSSSGKSAFIRALRIVAHNSNATSYVTHGRKVSTISAKLDDTEVTLERGPGKSIYTLVHNGEETKLTKCGTSVPAQVAEIFRLFEIDGSDINFASQFDRPFLLAEPASKAAKVLGDLTNINIIFDAVREANRRRLAAGSELKIRSTDLEKLRSQLQSYRGLSERIVVLTKARELHQEACLVDTKKQALEKLVVELEVLVNFRSTLEVKTVELPDLTDTENLLIKVAALKTAMVMSTVLAKAVSVVTGNLEEISTSLTAAEKEFHDTLVEQGTCPLCGSSTAKEVHA